jgi:hypothetical protein
MMLITTITASRPTWILSAAVGIVLIVTGATKAVAPANFQRHLASLGLIPGRLLSLSVSAAAALEVAWGSALLVNAAPAIVLPASIGVFVLLSIVSWWGVNTGKADDCGCYGGIIQPSIGQSLALNAIFVTMIAISWVTQPRNVTVTSWQLLFIIGLTAVAALIAEWAQRYENKTGIPRFVSSPLKIGANWRHRWAHGATRGINGELIVALLGPDCPFCKQLVKIGNAMTQSPALPTVIGVVGSSPKRRDEFVADYGIRFPVAPVSRSVMNRLTQAVPTTLLVQGGVIREIWVGQMPPEFVERFRRAFFPDALVEKAKELGVASATQVDRS